MNENTKNELVEPKKSKNTKIIIGISIIFFVGIIAVFLKSKIIEKFSPELYTAMALNNTYNKIEEELKLAEESNKVFSKIKSILKEPNEFKMNASYNNIVLNLDVKNDTVKNILGVLATLHSSGQVLNNVGVYLTDSESYATVEDMTVAFDAKTIGEDINKYADALGNVENSELLDTKQLDLSYSNLKSFNANKNDEYYELLKSKYSEIVVNNIKSSKIEVEDNNFELNGKILQGKTAKVQLTNKQILDMFINFADVNKETIKELYGDEYLALEEQIENSKKLLIEQKDMLELDDITIDMFIYDDIVRSVYLADSNKSNSFLIAFKDDEFLIDNIEMDFVENAGTNEENIFKETIKGNYIDSPIIYLDVSSTAGGKESNIKIEWDTTKQEKNVLVKIGDVQHDPLSFSIRGDDVFFNMLDSKISAEYFNNIQISALFSTLKENVELPQKSNVSLKDLADGTVKINEVEGFQTTSQKVFMFFLSSLYQGE